MEAFADAPARDFVHRMLVKNYADGIMLHHPRADGLDGSRIAAQTSRLVDSVFEALAALKGSPDSVFSTLAAFSRANPSRSDLWFPEFLDAYREYKHSHKLEARYARLKPYLNGQSYCDIGCGGGDLVYLIKQRNPAFKVCAGIDLLDWRTEEIRGRIDFEQADFTRPGSKSSRSYDTVTCMAVIHHAGGSPREIDSFAHGLRSAVAPGGTAIVEEDVVICGHEAEALGIADHLAVEIRKQPLLHRYTKFDPQSQKHVLTLIDMLSNCVVVGVPEMPFPCGFRSLGEWREILSRVGFTVRETRIPGFVKGNFNQSAHAWFVLGG